MVERYRPEPRETSRRSERMADLIRQAIGELLERGVKDPRIGFATVTSVRMSGDLRSARIFVSLLGDDKTKQQGMDGLAAATNFLRYQIAQRLNLRYTPAIEFQLDKSQEYNDRIDELIRRTHTKGSKPGGPQPGAKSGEDDAGDGD